MVKRKISTKKLSRQAQLDLDVDTANGTYDRLVEVYNALLELIDENTYVFEDSPKAKSKDAAIQFRKLSESFSKIKAEFDKIKQSNEIMGELIDEFEAVANELEEKRDTLKEEFAEIKREIDIPSLDPDEFLKLNRQLQSDKTKLSDVEKKEQRREVLEKTILDKAIELDNLWHTEFRTLQDEVKKINESESELSIEITYKGRKDKFATKIREIFRGSGIRSTAYDNIAKTYTDFIQIHREPTALQQILSNDQFGEFGRRFNDNLANLLSYQVENQIVIKYKGKPLAQHSLGQRASALILFLLAQRDCDVLIIDQPEDDLDSQTIYEDVIKRIKSLKGSMQFIFATHNANIPVPGDSERVMICDFHQTKIDVDSGNVDRHTTQNRIVDVMEGGKDAFEHRKKIYDLWRID